MTGLCVGIYSGKSTRRGERSTICALLAGAGDLRVCKAGIEDLSRIDVLVVTGPSGTKLAKGLGAEGCAAIDDFVRRGGGYVGLRGGAYLATQGYNGATRRLALLNALPLAYPKWVPAQGEVALTMTPSSPFILPKRWSFEKGPLFVPACFLDQAPYQSWARFATDLHGDDTSHRGKMLMADAIVAGPHGRGRAVAFGVDPLERAQTTASLLQAIRWASQQEVRGAVTAFQSGSALDDTRTKVAVLHGGGCSNRSIGDLLKLQTVRHDRLDIRLVHPGHLVAGRLAEFDVFVCPGGTAKYQWPWLGEDGREAVKTFVRGGGGFVGICAGAFLARVSDGTEPQRLELAAVVHRACAKRPRRADAICSVTPSFRAWSGIDEDHLAMEYAAGPMLYAIEHPDLPPVEPLAIYESWPAGPANAGRIGALAALRTRFGRGRVLLYSPHPEHTRGLEDLVVRSLLWAGGRESSRRDSFNRD